MHHLKVTVSGTVYEVQVELLDAPVDAAKPSVQQVKTPPLPATSNTGASQPILSPLAASVVSIDTTLGAQVQAGQTVVTLEAMKMNTIVTASEAGLVKGIEVAAGDTVEEGQVLITIDPIS
jgi:biotin carboxyl carrier protein